MQSDFIKIFDLSEQGKELETHFRTNPEIANIQAYGQAIDKKTWLPKKDFSSAKTNLLLGRATENVLPDPVRQALRNLSLGEPPPVVILRGMPTGAGATQQPETGIPLCAFSLRGVAAILGKQDAGSWDKARYSQKMNFDSYRNTGVQPLHSDYVLNDDDIEPYQSGKPLTNQVHSILHCVKADPLTPTYFVPYTLDRAKTLPDPDKDAYVIFKPGDIVVFNNIRVLHARGARLPSAEGMPPETEKERHVIAINIEVPFRELGTDLAKENGKGQFTR